MDGDEVAPISLDNPMKEIRINTPTRNGNQTNAFLHRRQVGKTLDRPTPGALRCIALALRCVAYLVRLVY